MMVALGASTPRHRLFQTVNPHLACPERDLGIEAQACAGFWRVGREGDTRRFRVNFVNFASRRLSPNPLQPQLPQLRPRSSIAFWLMATANIAEHSMAEAGTVPTLGLSLARRGKDGPMLDSIENGTVPGSSAGRENP